MRGERTLPAHFTAQCQMLQISSDDRYRTSWTDFSHGLAGNATQPHDILDKAERFRNLVDALLVFPILLHPHNYTW